MTEEEEANIFLLPPNERCIHDAVNVVRRQYSQIVSSVGLFVVVLSFSSCLSVKDCDCIMIKMGLKVPLRAKLTLCF